MPQLCKPAVPSSAESTVMAKRISSVQNFLFFIVFSLFTFHFSLFHFSLLTFGRPLSRLDKDIKRACVSALAAPSVHYRFYFFTTDFKFFFNHGFHGFTRIFLCIIRDDSTFLPRISSFFFYHGFHGFHGFFVHHP